MTKKTGNAVKKAGSSAIRKAPAGAVEATRTPKVGKKKGRRGA